MTNPFEVINARLQNIEGLLLDLYDRPATIEASDKHFTVPETAEYLNLAIPTIYGLVSRREIPHQKKGKRLYFLKSKIDEWLAEGSRKTITEIENEINGEQQ